jgi:1-acyl-sn-glycerol-3-phosphate acyltransferase
MGEGNVIVRSLRAALTLLLFAFFALGGIVISALLMALGGKPKSGQRMVRMVWRFLIWICIRCGLISVDAGSLKNIRGRIIVANHPSLIDVVILTAYIGDAYSIAKSDLKRSLFFGEVIKRVMIANDEFVLEKAKKILDIGGNVLIFPEGTRTPLDGTKLKLHRGAAQLSIRLATAITPIRIEMSRRILAKGQSVLDMGAKTVNYRLIVEEDIFPPAKTDVNRGGALAMTAAIEKALFPPAAR